jgi:ATP-binding cassette subfamily F protein 3
MAIITLSGVTKSYAGHEVLRGVDLQIEPKEHIALVGANGAGKSTLLRVISGREHPDDGSMQRHRRVSIGYLAQEASFQSRHTLRDALLEAFAGLRQQQAQLRELEAELAAAGSNPAAWSPETLERYTELMERFEQHGGYNYEQRLEQVLTGLGFARDQWDRPARELSGGQRTRAHLGRLLLEEPDVLLLDEPTNHLDLSTTEWLENFLIAWPQTLFVVSHDRYFLDRVTKRTIEIVDGKIESYPAAYTRFLELRDERYSRRHKEFVAQQETIAKTEDFIRRFRAGQRAREARGRQTRLDRVERLADVPREERLHFDLESGPTSGHVVLATTRLRIGFKDKQLLRVANTQVLRGAKIALLGPNGCGKSTLLRTLVEELAPLGGAFEWGHNVVLGYYAQAHEGLDPKRTALQEIMDARPMSEDAARSFLARFLFTGEDAFKHVGNLSGGERSRVALAKLTLQPSNMLLLDEPTNHLDIAAREVLEEVLREYDGTVIMVSHDRYFISAVADQIWAVEDDIVRVYEAGYAEYLTLREQGRYQMEVEPAPAPVTGRKSKKKPAKPAQAARPQEHVAWAEPIAGAVAEVVAREQAAQVTADRLAYPGTRGLDELVTLARAHGEQAAGLGAATDTLVEALWHELRASPLHDS